LGETHSGKTEPLPIYSNPLFRSGLLLANAQEAMKENGEGVLTAFEAMNLKLDNTELVVLSACETGLGEVAVGEGVYGLQRAFQVAGAGSVMMSLWKVDDDVTRQLMVSFYRNWLQLSESSKRTALQNAQKELKTKYPHPYYWAGFVLVGD
jgi:CHAT domain-containing protein